MEIHTDIWFKVVRFLGDGSVASVGLTCQTLSHIATRELKLRAGQYLESENPLIHALYPIQGYFWEPNVNDGNEVEGVFRKLLDDNGEVVKDVDWEPVHGDVHGAKGALWKLCTCDHHKLLFRGKHCQCDSNLDRLKFCRKLTFYRCCVLHKSAWG